MAQSDSLDRQVPFGDLCAVLEKISATKKQSVKHQTMLGFFGSLRRAQNRSTDSFYPFLRLVLPHLDKDRSAFGLKEQGFARRLIRILGIDRSSPDAVRLLQYRQPSSRQPGTAQAESSDFACIASSVIQARISGHGGATIHDVNCCLDSIADGFNNKCAEAVQAQVLWCCKTLEGIQLKWFIRMLLKRLKIGLSSDAILKMYHPDASQLYDVTVSLKRVCEQLPNLDASIALIEVALFKPFRPMLACLVLPDDVPAAMNGEEFYVETKFDGERVQMHRNGEAYKYFSRNGGEFTSCYGGTPLQGSLTQYVHHAFKASVRNCILDGEMIGWNRANKCFATKGEHVDVKQLRSGDSISACYVVFDLLLLNDTQLVNLPLRQRLERLREVVDEIEDHLMIAKQRTTSSVQEVVNALSDAIGRREEGIVIKNPQSTYRPNARSYEAGWLKIKPDYIHGLCDQLDLLVVGGYFGTGRRSSLLSHFMLAVLDESTKDDAQPTFLSVGRVGSGYTVQELYNLNIHLSKAPLQKSCPDWLRTSSEKAEVYIQPECSVILQVKAAQIVSSKAFAVGYTLRFPRVEMIRRDKSWRDCMTKAEFLRLNEIAEKQIVNRLSSIETNRKVTRTRKRRAPTVPMEQSPSKRLCNIKPLFNAFEGRQICILNGTDQHSKEELEQRVAELGGTVVQNPVGSIFCAVSGKVTVKVQAVISSASVDVAKVEWLLRCWEKQKLIAWCPVDLIFATASTRSELSTRFDRFGDSYLEPVSPGDLRRICDKMQAKDMDDLPTLANQLKEQLFGKYSLLSGFVIYFDPLETIGDWKKEFVRSSTQRYLLTARLYGAAIAERINETTTHVLVHSSVPERREQFERQKKSENYNFEVVTEKWLQDNLRRRND
uniref:DNA ligase n=1 Tax=Trichuris muris TaxID=70415 RepID=A0A5S6QX03_TRIMR